MEACGPRLDAKLKEAVDVLAARGFPEGAVRSFVFGAEQENDCANAYGDRVYTQVTWPAYLEAKNLPQNPASGGILDAVRYDINTGDRYDFSDPAAVARKIPSCFKNGKPYRDCKPKFHPYVASSYGKVGQKMPDGSTVYPPGPRACRLTRDYRKFCSMARSLDGCWSYARGDMIMLPGEKTGREGLLQLARAKRKATRISAPTIAAASAPAPQKKASTPVKHTDWCEDDIGFDTILKKS